MPAFRRIIVGLDSNPKTRQLASGGAAALACARWLASGDSVRCTLLHSTAADEFWDPSDGAYTPCGPAAPAREALEAAASELVEAGIETELEVTEERAWLAIVQRVIGDPADLVIVGKRCEPESGGPLLGSVAAKLLRKCPCAVWAVRPGDEAPPRTLLAATDLSPVGEHVLLRASQLAQQAGAKLHVVHSFQSTMLVQLEGDRSDFVTRTSEEARQSIRETLERVGYPGDAELHVGLSSPTRAILACVERYAPDLVVMATISRGGVAGLLLGNTAERIFQRLDASLLTVKPADFVCPVEAPESA